MIDLMSNFHHSDIIFSNFADISTVQDVRLRSPLTPKIYPSQIRLWLDLNHDLQVILRYFQHQWRPFHRFHPNRLHFARSPLLHHRPTKLHLFHFVGSTGIDGLKAECGQWQWSCGQGAEDQECWFGNWWGGCHAGCEVYFASENY